ncbi:hypothetical protein [uncultured Rubinisphaera sp.]|uniref:hypothetical protein n=1 Tax=uncultured Rubinisphaera sp. TaxID=1678686 RepID=UPI0030DC39E0
MSKETTETSADTQKVVHQQPYLSLIVMASTLTITLLQVIVLTSSYLPLGVSGEWVWPRIPAGNTDLFAGLFTVILSMGYLALLWLGIRWLDQAGRVRIAMGLVGLVFASLILIPTLRSVPAGIYGTAGTSWVTYYPRMSGYYTEAMHIEETYSEFLADYEDLVRQGDYLHQGTHPPGLILYFRLLKSVCTYSPALSELLVETESQSLQDGLDVLEQLAQENGEDFPESHRAVLSLNLWVTYLVAAFTVIPVFLISRQFVPFRAAWLVTGLWPLIPALSVFAPKSDLLLPFFSAWTAALWILSVRKNSIALSLLAGLIFWLGCWISLAVIVVPVILAVWVVLNSLFETIDEQNRFDKHSVLKLIRGLHWKPAISSLFVFIVMTLFTALIVKLNLWTVWRLNLQNHATFYDHNTRTYLSWLIVNPLELIFTLGPAVSILVLGTVWTNLRQRVRTPATAWTLAVFFVWSLLWLSGKNMGEAARLWIFLTPLFLSTGAGFLDQCLAFSSAGRMRTICICLFVCQVIVALVIVIQIDAFDFSSFLM